MLIFIRSLCFCCMLHVSARTLSVMVLQGTRCISLSKQFPPTSVICSSVSFFFFCLPGHESVCLGVSLHIRLTPRQRHTNCDPSVHMHADVSKHFVTWSQLGDEKFHSFPFVFLPCPSSPSPFECACFSGKSCKPKKTLLVFRWPADQVCWWFQFLILVKSSAAADWVCEE